MNWSDVQVFRDIIIVLATQGWQKLVDDEDSLDVVDRLATQFSTPLQGAGVQLEEIHAEFESMLEYSTRYLSLSTLPYRASWWRIFHAPCASDWHNFLVLVELLFSLPSSNGKVKCIFSQVDVIKTEKRTRLCNEALDDLLMIRKISTQKQLLLYGQKKRFEGPIRRKEESINAEKQMLLRWMIVILKS